MIRFLVYSFPAMIDIVLGATFFISAVRIAESGASKLAVTSAVAVWAVVYMLVSQVAGTFVTPKNAAGILIAASLGVAGCCFLFIVFSSIVMIYVNVGIQAVASAFFFATFQVFMKEVEGGGSEGVALSAGLYTFAWSTGMAIGPFYSGYVWEKAGWEICYLINVAIALGTAAGIYWVYQYGKKYHENHMDSNSKKRPSDLDYSKMPDLAWAGWFCAGIGCLTVAMVRSYFPASATALQISKSTQGNVLALFCFIQGLAGLFLCRGRLWMYKTTPLMLFAVSGIAGLLFFGIFSQIAGIYLSAILFGIYTGSCYFYFVFHSLVHPKRSARYVAVNESIVGLTCIIGPLLAGFLGDKFSLATPYYAAAILLMLSMIAQFFIHLRVRGQLESAQINR